MTRLSSQLLTQARPLPPWDEEAGEEACVAALLSGGDSRLAPDPATGLNKYLCAATPDAGVVRLASCTASPISAAGFSTALACHREVSVAGPRAAEAAARDWQARIETAILQHFGAEGLADVKLLPSGTDGVLWTSCMLAREAPGRRVTAILPSASETGTGVPLAASCRCFDAGPGCGAPAADAEIEAVHVPLRDAAGEVRGDDALNAAFASAASAARGRRIVYLTHGSKTGLVAPLEPPAGAEIVVDACQMRIAPSVVRDCLRRGWPVVVTGSKVLGGPPFSGAVLSPRGRFPHADEPAGLGPLLRWAAALDGLQALSEAGDDLPAALAHRTSEIHRALGTLPGVEIAPGPSRRMCEAAGWPASIVTFTVRDASDPSRRRTADQLRALHRGLAGRGVLVGQPVDLGPFGGLRLAVGARDAAGFGDRLDRFAAAFRQASGVAV